jgi:hypothetical protein
MEEQIKAYIIKRLMARGVSQIDASGNANFLSRDISRTLESSITSLIGELPKDHSPRNMGIGATKATEKQRQHGDIPRNKPINQDREDMLRARAREMGIKVGPGGKRVGK